MGPCAAKIRKMPEICKAPHMARNRWQASLDGICPSMERQAKANAALALVPDSSQECAPRLRLLCGFDALRRRAVDHSQYSSALLALGHHHLHRIRGRAVDGTHFGNVF